MVRYGGPIIMAGLGRADVHPAIDHHRVTIDDLGGVVVLSKGQSELDGQSRLSTGRWPHQGDDGKWHWQFLCTGRDGYLDSVLRQI